MSAFGQWWQEVGTIELTWLAFGFGAQAMFFMRFVAQWLVSEKHRRSIVPEAFWYFSLSGGLMMLIYGVHRADPVIIVGQFTGLFIYSRNIYFIWREKRALPVPATAASRVGDSEGTIQRPSVRH